MAITLVEGRNIDFSKWDNCIAAAINGLVYAYSWYLNITAENWDALVENDYESVFPLVYKKKIGIYYLYQPFFTQQLGLFSKRNISNEKVEEFIKAIPSKYKYIKINLNTLNSVSNSSIPLLNRITYQLDLIQPYKKLSAEFNENTRRNIARSHALGVSIIKGLSIEDFQKIKLESSAIRIKGTYRKMMVNIISQSISNGVGEIYAAYSKNNELCAAAFFIKGNGRLIYLFASSNSIGKENRAMFRLVNHVIFMNSETSQILDFEGSNIESIARFYSGFGAIPCSYQQIAINRLPAILKPFV